MEDEMRLQPATEGPPNEQLTDMTSSSGPGSRLPGFEEAATRPPSGPAPDAAAGRTSGKNPAVTLGIFAASLWSVIRDFCSLLLRRHSRHSVKATIGGNEIEISRVSAEQERLVKAWFIRSHTAIKGRSNQLEAGQLEVDQLVQEELDKIYINSLDHVLSVKEVRDGAQQAGLDLAFLRNHSKRAAAEIWRSAAQERERFVEYASNPDNRVTLTETHRLFPWIKVGSREIFPWNYSSLPLKDPKFPRPRWLGTSHIRLSLGGDVLVIDDATPEQRERLLVAWIERTASGRLELQRALLEKGMLPFIRTLLNEYMTPSYNTQLLMRNAPGLSEVFDPVYHIQTQSAARLQRLMEQIPGGSIGISGPRGVGKTTLIRSCTAGSITEAHVLSVMVSAPVDYAARDFILHLFETVCRKVAEAETHTLEARTGATPAAVTGTSLTNHKLNFVALGLAIAIIGGGIVLREQFQIPMKIMWTAVGILVAILGVTIMLSTLARSRSTARVKIISKVPSAAVSHLDQLTPLRILASQRLQEIKFQQSFSTGWSGTLSIPIGVQASLTGNATMAQLQMTLPDVVEALREFLSRAASAGRVIVGIDELDKIGSDEKARQFLNDIKGIFGLEHCFYLVSVSEEAMASFERRGLPFRDVFDSSFDEIIKVPYLGFDDAKQMLARRVLGLPVPFAGFCYCMSGGLPRDLIRAARRLIDIPRPSVGELTLGHAATTLLRDELAAKTEAVVAAAMGIGLEPEVSQVIRWADALDLAYLCSEKLLSHCRRFVHDIKFNVNTTDEQDTSRISRQTLVRLSRELLGLYYYCSTILEFFNDDLESTRLRAAEEPEAGMKSLDYLARSRNTFAINASVAWTAVSGFRAAWDMEVLELP
jgi:hypothetical protein